MRKKLIAVMTAGVIMTIAGAPVQAAEGEKDVVVAQADGNVGQDSVDRANELLNAMLKKVVFAIMDGNSMSQTKTWQIHFMPVSIIQ